MFLHFSSLLLYYIYTHFHYLIFIFGSFLPKDARVNLVDLVKSCQTSYSNEVFERVIQTSIYYLFANIGVDTAESEPSNM